VILNRESILAAVFGLTICFVLVFSSRANGQLQQPNNSLRTLRAVPVDPVRQSSATYSLFASPSESPLDFKTLSESIADAVLTDQQLADFAFAPRRESKNIIRDNAVRPTAFSDTGQLSQQRSNDGAFSSVVASPSDTNSASSRENNEPILAEMMPADISQAPPLPKQDPLPAHAPFGPALPADYAFDKPVSRQLVGDLQEEIQHQRDLLKSSHDTDDEEYNRRARLLEESFNLLGQAKKFLKKDFIQKNSIKTFEADKKILQDKLAVERKPHLPQGSESADDLFAQLESLRQEMESLNSRLHELNKTELQHKVRLGEIPKDRADSRKAIGDLDKQLKNEELGSADTFVMIRIRAEELAMEYHIDSLDSESKLYELENRLLPLNGDLLAREVKILEAEIENWNHAANQRRRQDLEEEARLARAQLVDAAPSLRQLATLNSELTERRIKFTEQIRAATEEEIEVKELLNSVHSQHETVEKSIIDNKLSQANGLLLVDVRRKIIRPFQSRKRIREINRELQKISLERITLNEQREPLSHPVEYAAEKLKGVHSDSISDEQLSTMALEIVENIRQQYDQLSADHHTYIDLLGKIVVERKELVREIDATMQFVNKNSLWVRSARPINIEQINKSRSALAKFFSPQQWTQLMADLIHRCMTSPHESAAGLIGLVALFTFSRRFKP